MAEVDFEYLLDKHEEHNDYPLAPESVCPDKRSDYMQSVGPVDFETGGGGATVLVVYQNYSQI